MNVRSKISALVVDKEELAPAFTSYLIEKDLLDPIKLKSFRFDKPLNSTSLLKQLWGSTSLSSHEFANEVAAFFGLRRVTLLQLTEFRSLADRFSTRFLRDASIFPFETLTERSRWPPAILLMRRRCGRLKSFLERPLKS